MIRVRTHIRVRAKLLSFFLYILYIGGFARGAVVALITNIESHEVSFLNRFIFSLISNYIHLRTFLITKNILIHVSVTVYM